MKNSIRFLLLTASAAVGCQAAPFMAVGDGAELFATGVVGVRWDDNILLASDAPPAPGLPSGKMSDTIFEITPGLELDFGKNAQTQGSLTLADSFTQYSDHSKYNTNLFAGDFVAKFDDGKMKLGGNLSYHELNQNTVDVRGLIRRDVANAGANGEVSVSDITAVGAAVTFNH
jgi:hypothetical protein